MARRTRRSMHPRKLLHWKALFIYLHRWMGIVFGLVFAAWFISGVAMMYVGMPHLSARERLFHVPQLDLSTAAVSPADAARRHHLSPQSLRVEMSYTGRPIYRFADGQAVYADTGDGVPGASAEEAVALVRQWWPAFADQVRYDARLDGPDQWTLQGAQRAALPLHRIALGDPAGTYIYVSEATGEPVMKTDRRGRLLGGLSAVLHWTYFTALRRHGPLWLEVVAWGALAGAGMSVLGLAVGIVRVRRRVYRLRAGLSHSPYSGWMKWHHYTGLVFGVVTVTWAFSGAMSLGRPFPWLQNQPATNDQRTAVAGTPLDLASVTLEALRQALAAVEPRWHPKQLDVRQVRGQAYLIAPEPAPPTSYAAEIGANEHQTEVPPRRAIVPASAPGQTPLSRFPDDTMWDIARAAMPGVEAQDAIWLDEYDVYYYSQNGSRPLPVLRLRYADPAGTWIYLDPAVAALTIIDRGARWNRWLYHGLHSLDFPFWYYRRPLWDAVMIGLSLGGLALSLTTLVPTWRRLARHARRFADAAGRSGDALP